MTKNKKRNARLQKIPSNNQPKAGHQFNKAIQLFNSGQPEKAKKIVQAILKAKPNQPEAVHLLGGILFQQGDTEKALELIRTAIDLRDDQHEWHKNLAYILAKCERYAEAAQAAYHAVQLKPDYKEAYYILGEALFNLRDHDNAITAFANVLQQQPDNAAAYDRLSSCLNAQGKTDQAIHVLITALEHSDTRSIDDQAQLCVNLATLYHRIGLLDEGIHFLNKAVTLDPESPAKHSALISTLMYRYDFDEQIFANYLLYNARHCLPFASEIKAHDNNRAPERKLKIGYVSADFHHHAVAFYIKPILQQHNRQQFSIYCYYNNTVSDHETDIIKSLSDHWRPCVTLSDIDLTEQIRSDGIDILIDLSGHTVGNRLPVFARKPAPLQISFIGFPTTTGLTTMDYFITNDGMVDEQSAHYFTEKCIQIGAAAPFKPPEISPDITDPPCLSKGYITFASFNRSYKITDAMIALWSEVIKKTPNSKMLVHIGSQSETVEALYLERFKKYGVDAERIEFYPLKSTYEYFDDHNRVDICLDTFPYNGATTSRISVWMGVPVITLKGVSAQSRISSILLTKLGLKDLIAEDEAQFVEIALKLAHDTSRLSELKHHLRDRVRASGITDEANITQTLEAIFRQAWMQWCATT
ncbi:MAG: tetratricopeptide repeat protein [Methylococcales bacterium]|nr:tetratricopeptide repeat protein [Methylococcales bacterium]